MTTPNEDVTALLLTIEEKILEYRDESRRLDQCQRLYDASALQNSFELKSLRFSQDLEDLGGAIVREQSSVEGMVLAAKQLTRDAKVALCSYVTLPTPGADVPTPSSAPHATNFSPAASAMDSQTASPTGPTPDFYSGIPSKPTPFLRETVARLEAQLSEYGQRIDEEVERLFVDPKISSGNGRASAELCLLHDFFIRATAKVESCHDQIEKMKRIFIADRRRRGDDSNPFLEADRRETAQREAALTRVHPILHVPTLPQSIQALDIGSSVSPMAAIVDPGSEHSHHNKLDSVVNESAAPVWAGQGTVSSYASSSSFSPVQSTPSTSASNPFGSSTPLSALSTLGPAPAASSTPPLLQAQALEEPDELKIDDSGDSEET